MKLERRRGIGIATGLTFGVVMVTCLGASGSEQFHAKGPMNSGHADLACESCHREAAGTSRQQLQNAARELFGLESVAVDVGFRPVENANCNTCHEQKDDRHPSFRFLEPRFAEARAAIHPETCTSCHAEHAGKRVTIAETTYCRNCHTDTVLEKDPLDVSHRTLIADGRWETCLGCHDYHGNHTFEPPHRVKDVIPHVVIERYFEGGVSPYPPPRTRARQPEVP
ncbi:MAG: cytochrome c3 family protein [Kofleriaceae bacterium]